MTACQSTPKLTVSYQTVEIPSEPKKLDPVKAEIKAEPAQPVLPAPGTCQASDIRAQRLGLYAVALRKWGRGMVTIIDERERATDTLFERQKDERAAALARFEALQDGQNEGKN